MTDCDILDPETPEGWSEADDNDMGPDVAEDPED